MTPKLCDQLECAAKTLSVTTNMAASAPSRMPTTAAKCDQKHLIRSSVVESELGGTDFPNQDNQLLNRNDKVREEGVFFAFPPWI